MQKQVDKLENGEQNQYSKKLNEFFSDYNTSAQSKEKYNE
jgi:hypothetical protein